MTAQEFYAKHWVIVNSNEEQHSPTIRDCDRYFFNLLDQLAAGDRLKFVGTPKGTRLVILKEHK